MTSKAAAFSHHSESFIDSFDYYSDHETTLLDTLGVDADYAATALYHDHNVTTVFSDHVSQLDGEIFLAHGHGHDADGVFAPVDHESEALDGEREVPYIQEFSREWDPTVHEFDDYDEYDQQEDYVEEPYEAEVDMSSIPNDFGTQQTVRDIIARQFDLEIANRNRELQIIEHRIAQGEWLLEQLEQAWNNRGSACHAHVEAGTKRKKEKVKKRNKHSKKAKKKKIKSPLPPYSVFSRRPDGTFVQLICPKCRRSRFKDQLGFVNHCRIMHKLKFSSYMEAADQCGIPVDESDIPEDDPSRAVVVDVQSSNRFSLSGAETTRFYVKKRITVGNTSKRLPPSGNYDDKSTHKWTVFIIGPDDDPDLGRYVRKVVFFLHPDFKPNNVIEVESPPFQLTRRGWGEFPVRLQLHFVDRRNKPKDIIHSLKLDKSNTRDDIIVSETPATLELDRRFFTDEEVDRPPPSPPTLTDNIDCEGNVIPPPQVTARMFDEYMRAAVRHYPVVSFGNGPRELPYSAAKSEEEWNSWNLGKRRSAEWQRARQVRAYLRRKLGHDRTTKEVLYWCRENGHVPEKHFVKKYHQATRYCKHCGIAHTPQHDFVELESACGEQLAGSHPLNTSSTAVQAFSFLDPLVTFEDIDEVDVDIMGLGPIPNRAPSEEDEGELLLEVESESLCQYSGEDAMEFHSAREGVMGWVRDSMEDTTDLPLDSTSKDARVVESLLFKTVCNFAKDLVQKSLREVKPQFDQCTEPVLVPYHVFLGANGTETLDFLTNKGMQDLNL